MANYFGVPDAIEVQLRARDRSCVYCRKVMKEHSGVRGTPHGKATLEHFSFDGPFRWGAGLEKSDVAFCCGSCNSSRGVKRLVDWFRSPYCIQRGINEGTVAEPVKDYLRRYPRK